MRDGAGWLVRPRLVGREEELRRLRRAMEAVSRRSTRVVFITGDAGMGKSSLVDELAVLAEEQKARFVAAKFDTLVEKESTALVQAAEALARSYDVDASEERALLRGRILRVLGPHTGLARIVPGFAALLADVPGARAVDPAHAAARVVEVVAGLLRATASAERPVVLALEDLHWSGSLSARLIETVQSSSGIEGLLLVGTFREGGIAPPHPMAAAVARWAAAPGGPEFIRLGALARGNAAQLVQVLAGTHADTGALADSLYAKTQGNPFEIVELVKALQDDGLLAHAENARTNGDAVRAYLARTSVEDVLAARIARLPEPARGLLRVLDCLGTHAGVELAARATGLARPDFEAAAMILQRERLVLRAFDPDDVLRVQHQKVCIAIRAATGPRLADVRLAIARRLAAFDAHAACAAAQYAAAAEGVTGRVECRRAAALMQSAAAKARQEGRHRTAAGLLRAALSLLDRAASLGDPDAAACAACEAEFHLALLSVGELEQADAIHRRLQSRDADAPGRVDSTCAQVASLSNRGRISEALALGLSALRDLGVGGPEALSPDDASRSYERLRAWVESFDLAAECARADACAPQVVAAAKLLGSLQAPAFYEGPGFIAWLVFRSHELWVAHGPCAPLAPGLCRASMVTVRLRQDWRSGYLAARHVLDLCEQRGWEQETALARYYFALGAIHWFEPLERKLRDAERAREGLVVAGDLGNACFCSRSAVVALLDCGLTLQEVFDENEAALALAHRAGNQQVITTCLVDRQLIRSLRGETARPGDFGGEGFDERRFLASIAGQPQAQANHASRRAIACAIFQDADGLWQHTRAMQIIGPAPGLYQSAWMHWLGGLALAWRLESRDVRDERERAAILRELEACAGWLRHRAIDAPGNFRHMHLHLVAELALASADFDSAARGFDEAVAAAEASHRPWHFALVCERAGRVHQAQGWCHSAARLLTESRRAYEAWGACAKAASMPPAIGRPVPAAGELDARGRRARPGAVELLRASQSVIAERNSYRLQARVEDVLRELAGATRVVVALWDTESAEWVLRQAGGEITPLAGAATLLPLSVFRYAEAVGEPVLLADAVTDDRFAREPYFRGMERCSLMAVPILRQGTAKAMLVLENRDAEGAFSMDRLESVMMIASQLAVSLESAQLYESLERQVRAQTRELEVAQSRLVVEARRAGMAQIATSVLHNVGNVLNSVNVSARVLSGKVLASRGPRVGALAELLARNAHDLRGFFESDPKGRLLPRYVLELADALATEREQLLGELTRLEASIDHIKKVVAMQQSYAGSSGVLERADVIELCEDALRIEEDALTRHGIQLAREYEPVDTVPLDKTRVMQILVNFIENARHAMQHLDTGRRLVLAARQAGNWIELRVSDSGCGIASQHLERIFSHGFTTKPDGHGFGLHSCAVAAREMGGGIEAASDGPGRGATFVLRLPADGAQRAPTESPTIDAHGAT